MQGHSEVAVTVGTTEEPVAPHDAPQALPYWLTWFLLLWDVRWMGKMNVARSLISF